MTFKEKYTILASLSNQKKRKFSEVYACEDSSSKERFVLKQVIKNPHNTLEQDRLRSEASFSFHKKGLPVICDFFEDEISIQVVKKYEAGIPLDEFIYDLTPRKRRTLLGQLLPLIADLLKSIHEQEILHLDIKPSNILVAKFENSYRVALIDFGMAIRMDQFEERKTLFPLGFAAPELILNKLAICNRTTDYYSLGITLWNCLTNRLPLVHPNPSIFTNLQLNHPLPESTVIPRKYFMLLEKLCAKYSFEVPANQLKKEDVIARLQDAQNKRYQELREFTIDWITLTQNSWWRS